jgi:hypothetical protein
MSFLPPIRSPRFAIPLAALAAASLLLLPTRAARADIQVTVPGTANLWLAGMPDGTEDAGGDVAPANSPTHVPGLDRSAGIVAITAATGNVNNLPSGPGFPPDGNPDDIQIHQPANWSKSGIWCPQNALIGVFLTDAVPDGPEPPLLDFTLPASRDYAAISPLLAQVFFIGDGQTSADQQQFITVPAGATRFFLAPMDAVESSNNWGSFSVTVAAVPEPATALLLAGAVGWLARARRRR